MSVDEMLQSKGTESQTGLKNKSLQYAAYKRPTLGQRTHRDWKWRGWKKIFRAKGNENKVGVTILISDKTDVKAKAIRKDKEGNNIMTKGSKQEEDFYTCQHICTQYRSTKYIK